MEASLKIPARSSHPSSLAKSASKYLCDNGSMHLAPTMAPMHRKSLSIGFLWTINTFWLINIIKLPTRNILIDI